MQSDPFEINRNFTPVWVYMLLSVNKLVTISLIPSKFGSDNKGLTSAFSSSGTI